MSGSFVRRHPELLDATRVYEVPFIEVINSTRVNVKHLIAPYAEYAGRQLYVGLPDNHIMAPGGWPREYRAYSPSLNQVLTRYAFSATMHFGKPMMYFVQYNEGKRPQFAYLRDNQNEVVLATPKDATHVLISLQYRAKSLSQGGSTKDWAENQGAVGFYKMDTDLPAQKNQKIYTDVFIFELGGRFDEWQQLRYEAMHALCLENEKEQYLIESFFKELGRNKERFHDLRNQIAKKGVDARYYKNSMDLVFQRGKAGCGQEVCYNFRYTGAFYGALKCLLNDTSLWAKLENNREAWIERQSSGRVKFSEIKTWIPWWYTTE